MKQVVMGTAGHIDHGKTALVHALTGIDTDRLKEEKQRGMTIELGFAPFVIDEQYMVSIVDVPGHEKFVKRMVAGSNGIDFSLLVIAADEGIMPQTREHMTILNLLRVHRIIIAITKVDLVDREWLELVKGEISQEVHDTVFKDAPIVCVSTKTGEGVCELTKQIKTMAIKKSNTKHKTLMRLPVDRVFTLKGHGTVVTGTLLGGKIGIGDDIEIIPTGICAKIRNVQVHGKNIEFSVEGERCAINIPGISKDDIKIGDVITFPNEIDSVQLVDAVIENIQDNQDIRHNQRVHINIGTKEVLARIRIIGKEQIAPKTKGYVQLRFEEKVALMRGDRFIVRAYSPVMTIGGGEIIAHKVPKRGRWKENQIEIMKCEEQGGKIFMNMLLQKKQTGYSEKSLYAETLISKRKVGEFLEEQVKQGKAIGFKNKKLFVGQEVLNEWKDKVKRQFLILYDESPYQLGFGKEELRSKMFGYVDEKLYDELIQYWVSKDVFKVSDGLIQEAKVSRKGQILGHQDVQQMNRMIKDYKMDIKKIDQIIKESRVKEKKAKEIIDFLIKIRKLILIGDSRYIHGDILDECIQTVSMILQKEQSITVAKLRDEWGIGRKAIILLLEYLDEQGITIRDGNKRHAGPKILL